MQIKVKASSIVKPAKKTPKHTLRSSNLDLLVPSYHLPTIYFYKSDGSSNFFDTHLLKEALSNCLVVFYTVAARLKRREEGGSGFDIDCNGEGVLIVEAECEGGIDGFGDFTPCFELLQLIPTSDESFSLPILMLQVTYFKCGGASLGVGFQHTLVDGISAIHFINAWSDMTRGLSVTILPFLDRSLLSGRNPSSPTYHYTEYNPPPSMKKPIHTTKEPQTSPKLTTTATIKITRDQLNNLKANAKQDKNSERYMQHL